MLTYTQLNQKRLNYLFLKLRNLNFYDFFIVLKNTIKFYKKNVFIKISLILERPCV